MHLYLFNCRSWQSQMPAFHQLQSGHLIYICTCLIASYDNRKCLLSINGDRVPILEISPETLIYGIFPDTISSDSVFANGHYRVVRY